jgi:serine/threonine protein kinase
MLLSQWLGVLKSLWYLALCLLPPLQIIQREIKILADLGDGHLNIVHADEVLLTKTHVGLVMEYVSGGVAWHGQRSGQ